MSCAVILTAIPVEYMAVRSHLLELQEEVHDGGTIYERGKFVGNNSRSWDVGIVEVGAGNTGAAFEAERAIAYFKPSVVLFVGVAGGIKDVALGDVVAATKIYGYESGKVQEEFQPRPDVGESAYNLIHRARAEARKEDWLQRIKSPLGDRIPKVLVAPIAAGGKVIASRRSSVFKLIQSNYGDAVAVEMEGRGFLQATHASKQVDALVIRGISDLIDGKSRTDKAGWQEIAAYHASAFAFQILANLNHTNLQNLKSVDTPSTASKLTGSRKREFTEALMDAFRSEKDLEMMLSYELDWKLNQVAGGDNYREIVFNLIDYAEAQGQLGELLEAAKRDNPGNPMLGEFYL
ncbi:MAG: effector-associated domain EAD1-containing protein [Scytonema sp. PMC 1069.18]|nr:effector-associated domain EAD1-containing protein [Scytonema sp. PMC 1069.18]MEC4883296.1 effector-associated domain EAD1-containing protein [Scytonema sp. PMC 1070.18]